MAATGLWARGRYISSMFGASSDRNFTSAATPTTSRWTLSREFARCLPMGSAPGQ